MEDKKTDRRVVKTRMHMIQTTLELLRNNSFSKISVSDICEEAMAVLPFIHILKTNLLF